ncbi:M15 family metallopeptidase [Xenorhabdus bovienii]|uniref:M15 family metallopeptidase n=1 Tax=Xenorhabdus bovienii TaxID=40576 RepID=UPI0023B23628|nr:M15 family metallopeptidase [Xenorhabdus bovienii]MDE9455026.1 M15 family metallopeptidase [Xenorhabdus bovienii]
MTTNNFKLSQRSENNLKGVHPDLVAVVRRALALFPVDFTVIEGLRTLERQKQLVAEKKSRTMNSRHLTGHAVDLFPVGGNWNDYTCWLPVLNAMRQAGEERGIKLRFGITWTNNPNDKPAKFLDAPHIEIPA